MTRFWDTSAVLPLLVDEPTSSVLMNLFQLDEEMVVWWGTRIECTSALARRQREGFSPLNANDLLAQLTSHWSEIEPTAGLRTLAERLLKTYPSSAADALQLASAMIWAGGTGETRSFVCLDHRLRDSAKLEEFTVEPATG